MRARRPDALGGLGTVVLATALAALSMLHYLTSYRFQLFGDADWYATSTGAVLGARPLYPAEWLGPHIAERPPRFNLPPATSLFGPIASVSGSAWGLLMIACLVAGLVIMWPRRLTLLGHLLLGCGLVAWWPIWSALIWANINSLVFLLLAIAYRYPRHIGWALGVAAALKASPVLLLVILIGRRQWQQLGIALVTGAMLTIGAGLLVDGPRALGHFVLVQWHESHPPLPVGWSAGDFLPLPLVGIAVLVLVCASLARGGSWGPAVAAVLVAVPTLHLHYWIWALVPVLAWLDGLDRSFPAVVTPGAGRGATDADPRTAVESLA